MKIYVSAYLDNNLGDDLMLRLLLNSFPEHEFYFYCNDSGFLPQFNDCSNMHSTAIPPHKLVSAPDANFDAFMRIGGSIFIMRGLRSPIIRYLRAMKTARLTRCGLKTAIIGCNVNTFTYKIAQYAAQKELKSVGLVTVRDEESFNFAKPFNKNLYYCPDMLFSIPEQFCPSPSTRHGRLGISVYHSKYMTEQNTSYCRIMAEFCDEYIERTGNQISLLAFDVGKENDLLAAEEIIGQMKNSQYCTIHAHSGNGNEMLKEMAACSCIIGTRFHAIVLAIRLNIPFVPITYSEKSVNLLQDIGYTGARFDFSNMESVSIETMLNAVITPSYTLSVNPKDLIEQAGGHMKKLKEYFDE